MSRIRKNIEYYRIPDDIETDIDGSVSGNEAQNFNSVNQGDVAAATDRKIKNVADGGPDVNDAVNYGQLQTKMDTHSHPYLPLAGGTMTNSSSNINMNSAKITSLGTPTGTTDATNKVYVDGIYENVDGYFYDMKDNSWVAGSGSWGYMIHPGNFMSWWGTVRLDSDGWYHQMNIITKMAIHPTAGFSWSWSNLLAWVVSPIEIFAWTPSTTNVYDYPLFAISSDGANTISIRCLHANGTGDAVKRGFVLSGHAKT